MALFNFPFNPLTGLSGGGRTWGDQTGGFHEPAVVNDYIRSFQPGYTPTLGGAQPQQAQGIPMQGQQMSPQTQFRPQQMQMMPHLKRQAMATRLMAGGAQRPEYMGRQRSAGGWFRR